jgi:Tfp pilus assembly PilM family ATPase
MPVFENRIGLNVTRKKLQLIEICYDREGFILENISEAYFDDGLDLLHDKETKVNAILQSAFNEILIEKSIKSNFVSLSLPVELFFIHHIPYDNTLLSYDLIEEFRWEFSILHPYEKFDEYSFQYYEMDKSPTFPYHSAKVAAINRSVIKKVLSFVQSNNLKLKFIDNAHFSFDKALQYSDPLFAEGLLMSLFYSSSLLSIELLSGGKTVFYNSFKVDNAGGIVNFITDFISKSEVFKAADTGKTRAYIYGEEISDTILDSLNNQLPVEFARLNPFSNIYINPELKENKCLTSKPFSFAPAAGISFRLI